MIELEKLSEHEGFIKALTEFCVHSEGYGSHEEGGFILHKGEEFLFHPVANQVEGSRKVSLYEPCDEGMAALFDLEDQGWEVFASAHNHPHWIDQPSSTDLRYLFLGHPHNFIYSNTKRCVSLFDHQGKRSHRWWFDHLNDQKPKILSNKFWKQ